MPGMIQGLLAAEPTSAPEWLREHRENGRTRWQSSAQPTRKTETWKYTSLEALNRQFAPATSPGSVSKDASTLPDFGGNRLVLTDGFLRPELSNLDLPAGVSLLPFSQADEHQAGLIKRHLGSVVRNDKHLFANLNDALLGEGLFLHIGANIDMAAPLHILHITGDHEPAFSVNQRLLVLVEDNARGVLIEHFSGSSPAAFTNGITEMILGCGARVSHHRLHLEEGGSMHIGGVHTWLDRDSRLESFHLAFGSELKRIDAVVEHAGAGAHCDLNGIYLLRGREHVDYHTCIEHAVPHCTSDEVFRGIVGDEASAVFNGRIHIHPNAQKTRAELSNKNLLTSTNAEVNTKPELEIYADDVQCAHGATVARLDEGMLHYLRTRGIDRDEAEVMLSYGFINELVDDLQIEALKNFLRPLLAERFSRDPRLTRHLT